MLIIFITSCATAQNKNVENLTNEKFSEIAKQENVVILDVRTAKEYSDGHIPNAQNIDILNGDFEKAITNLNPEKTYLVYCKSGGRSSKACNMLDNQKFNNVYNLSKGFSGWNGEIEK